MKIGSFLKIQRVTRVLMHLAGGLQYRAERTRNVEGQVHHIISFMLSLSPFARVYRSKCAALKSTSDQHHTKRHYCLCAFVLSRILLIMLERIIKVPLFTLEINKAYYNFSRKNILMKKKKNRSSNAQVCWTVERRRFQRCNTAVASRGCSCIIDFLLV